MMAYKLLFISFLFLSFSAFAQPKKEYYDSEQLKLKSESNIVKGMPHGRHVEYYKNGNVSRKGSFYNGKEDSTWYFYYENKVLKAIENYNRGKKNGHNYYYSKTGELAQETVFNQNLPDSIWTSYHENKTVKSRESFAKGKKTGDWLYYFDNGQLESSGKLSIQKALL